MEGQTDEEEVPANGASEQLDECECTCGRWTAVHTRPALAKLVETVDRLTEERGMLKDEAYRQLMIEVKSVYQAVVADERTVTPGEDSENEDDDDGVSEAEFERVMTGAEALFGNSESVSHITQLVQAMMPNAAADDEEPSERRARALSTAIGAAPPTRRDTWTDDMHSQAIAVIDGASQRATPRISDPMRTMLERAHAMRRVRVERPHIGRAPDNDSDVGGEP